MTRAHWAHWKNIMSGIGARRAPRADDDAPGIGAFRTRTAVREYTLHVLSLFGRFKSAPRGAAQPETAAVRKVNGRAAKAPEEG